MLSKTKKVRTILLLFVPLAKGGRMETNMINLYCHGGSKNHGCEALVRSTSIMFDNKVRLFSNAAQEDYEYGVDQILTIEQNLETPPRKPSLKYYLSAVETKSIGTTRLETRNRFAKMLSKVNKDDIYISIGGDNYCYAGVEQLGDLNYWIKRKGAKTVLWGCSVEPELLEYPQVVKDLSRYTLITARESISYEALRQVNKNTILVSDPAFTLERHDMPLPLGWRDNNMVGINVSPLILQSADDSSLIFEAYCYLIKDILKNTDLSIALIPHVVWSSNDDRKPLRKLYTKFSESKRVVFIEDCNCMELKGYIARCRFFVGARTHATIAAYSNCVPTLVLGYSVKSRGIARDLFGTEDRYVLPVQKIKDKNELAWGFHWLLEHEKDIKCRLQTIMPEYINRACLAKKEVDKII